MKKNIMIIISDHEAAQIVKHNLISPNTNILCLSSMHEALLSFIDTEFCLVILGACISAEDDHMENCGSKPKDIQKVVTELYEVFDFCAVKEAADY